MVVKCLNGSKWSHMSQFSLISRSFTAAWKASFHGLLHVQSRSVHFRSYLVVEDVSQRPPYRHASPFPQAWFVASALSGLVCLLQGEGFLSKPAVDCESQSPWSPWSSQRCFPLPLLLKYTSEALYPKLIARSSFARLARMPTEADSSTLWVVLLMRYSSD